MYEGVGHIGCALDHVGNAVRVFGEGTPVQIGLLRIVQVKTAYVSCSEFYSMRTLLEGLLDSLTGMCVCAARTHVCVFNLQMHCTHLPLSPGHLPSANNGYSSYARCDNFAVFVKHLKKTITSPAYADTTTCIVSVEEEMCGTGGPNCVQMYVCMYVRMYVCTYVRMVVLTFYFI